MYASVPEQLAEMLLQTDLTIPVQFDLRSEKMLDVLESMAGELEASLCLTDELPAIEQAKTALFKTLGMAR